MAIRGACTGRRNTAAPAGPIRGAGIIFDLSPAGVLTDLYDFQGIPESAITNYDAGPNQLAAGPKGFFYGTTQRGGANGSGTLFEMAPSRQVAVLHVFSAEGTDVFATNSDGVNPTGALALGTNGSFYGTTQYGGANGNGTIFQVRPVAVRAFHQPLFVQRGGTASGTMPTERTPNGLVLGTDGNFYGTTQGGGANGAGTFFQCTIVPARSPTLYSFGETTNDAATPQAPLAQGPNGNFYGSQLSGRFGGERNDF
jgi:uncharacterized repeat protein (TIGR03803 family)